MQRAVQQRYREKLRQLGIAEKKCRRNRNRFLSRTANYRKTDRFRIAYHKRASKDRVLQCLAGNYRRFHRHLRVEWTRTRKRLNNKRRYANDPVYKLMIRLRTRIRGVLRQRKQPKKSYSLELLGCSWKAAKEHVERQFLPGMSWENCRLWHIDHIKPCASFNLADPEQQKLCFHWTNLQPLWGSENCRKGARLDWNRG